MVNHSFKNNFLPSVKDNQYNFLNMKILLCVCLMVLNTTFFNSSVILWPSVLLVEETRGPGKNHRPVASH